MAREYLTTDEKATILQGLQQGKSPAEIAKEIKKNYHMIYRYIHRYKQRIPLNSVQEEAFLVEQIVDHGFRFIEQTTVYTLHYLVKFLGYNELQWIPDNQMDCDLKLNQYMVSLLLRTGMNEINQ